MSGYFILGGLFIIVWLYSLFSVITGEFKNSNNKLVWIALLIFLPISAFLYPFMGTKQLVQQDKHNGNSERTLSGLFETFFPFLSFIAGGFLSLKLYKYLKVTYGLSSEDHYGIWGLIIMSSITTFIFTLIIIFLSAAIVGVLGGKNIKRIFIVSILATVAYFFIHTGINLYNKQSVKIEESFAQADKFYMDKKYEDAFAIYLKLAQEGHLGKKCRIGNLYLHGEGTMQNYIEAMKWYKSCAKENNMYAENNLGYMYINGYGAKENAQEAFKYFTKAADKNYSDAQLNLGYMYQNGEGVIEDIPKAIEFFKLSAKNGNKNAEKALQELTNEGIK